MTSKFFSDIDKPINDLLLNDFYHQSAVSIDVKSAAPNGVTFKIKGKTDNKKEISTVLSGVYSNKSNGLELTQEWNNKNVLDSKIEIKNLLTPGLKGKLNTIIVPNGPKTARLNFFYEQSVLNAHFFFNLLKKPNATLNLALSLDGFTAGGEVSYDIASAKINKYSMGVGYSNLNYTLAATATSNLSVFTAGYLHRISPISDVVAKTTWDFLKASKINVEFGTRYFLDKDTFFKAKICDSGLTALSYSQLLKPNVRLGLGVSFDVLKLSEPVHKMGCHLSFTS